MFTTPLRENGHSLSIDAAAGNPGQPDEKPPGSPSSQKPPDRTRKTNRTALRTLSPAAQFAYGYQSRPGNTAPAIDGLEALRQAALQEGQPETQVYPSQIQHFEISHSAPLSPLRERDIAVLAVLFQRDDIYDIEADIAKSLLLRLPEPCWEEDPFDFLQEFL